jgi:tRNA U34 2-thiouridine synthase MnmA/TrmU
MNTKDSVKAIGLLSGGLDSTLAVKLLIDQGIEVTAFNMITPFCTCTRKGCKHEAGKVAKQFGVPVKIIAVGEEYIEMIKHPKHGYGSNMNPCIDCRIFMFKKAKAYMDEIGARFIFTGEVLGQRPMSQHKRAMNLIEKESALQGLILRPLSAKLLAPTIPEEQHWIDREKLLDIQGRRRLPQIELAKKIGVKDYPCPGGGCRLTDPQFAKRIKEALDFGEDSIRDIQLLKYGRHIRLPSGAKVIVGRNEEENKVILQYMNPEDIALEVIGTGSPITLLMKHKDDDDLRQAAKLCIRYSDIENKDSAMLKIKKANGCEKIMNLSISTK